jgi:glycosyltransferase involved in cell wall biosynthesis
VSEGFGLPPIEALACGCVVFSSLNHALADSLDPGRLGHQLGAGTLSADLERISAAVADPAAWRAPAAELDSLLEASSEAALLERWREALGRVNDHWDRLQAGEPALQAPPLWRLRARRWRQRLARVTARRVA